MIRFGDAKNGQQLIDSGFKYVALYDSSCAFPTARSVELHFASPQKRWITQACDPKSSIIDFEAYTADYNDPTDLQNWLDQRERLKSARGSWIYCDLSNTPLVAQYVDGRAFKWWIATLDNTRRSRSELCALMLDWGCPTALAAPGLIAANQWGTNGDYDTSVCFVDADW